MTAGRATSRWHLLPIALAIVAAAWMSLDGRHHWDEPAYLYAGLHRSAAQIVAGDIQPSGIPHFSQGRILHALIAKGVMSVSPSGVAGFRAMIAINLLLLLASVALVFRILRDLLPDVPQRRVAAFLLATSPVILFLSFKTMADNEALAASLLATYALLALARGGPGALIAPVAVVALAISALSKNQMLFLTATLWVALVAVPIAGIDRRRLAVYGVGCGIAAFGLFFATLKLMGIGLDHYLASYLHLDEGNVPFIAKIVSVATELGALWLLLPFALLSHRRRELLAFGLSFMLATAPFLLFINSIEARHVAGNLVAVGGLLALALEALQLRYKAWGRMGDGARCCVAVIAVAILMASHALTLAIMPHRTQLGQMRATIDVLDDRYGAGRYVLLTSAGYTDFHLVRVLWPEVDARDASSALIAVTGGQRRAEALASYMEGRYLRSVEELRELDRVIVYFGYRETFAVENLRAIVAYFSPAFADRLLSNINVPNRMRTDATRWLWDSPDVRLEPVASIGHYHAYEVILSPQP